MDELGVVFALGIDYTGTPHDPLPEATADARRLADFFRQYGFASQSRDDLSKATSLEIMAALRHLADNLNQYPKKPQMLIYLAGHGKLQDHEYFTLTASSPKAATCTALDALSPLVLAQQIALMKAHSIILMVDSCHSGAAGQEIESFLNSKRGATGGIVVDVGILTSTTKHHPTYAGLFVENLIDALRNGPCLDNENQSQDDQDRYIWGKRDQFVSLLDLRDELSHRLGRDQTAGAFGCTGLRLPNPRYDPSIPDIRVEGDECLGEPSSESLASPLENAPLPKFADLGPFFVERRKALSQILGWFHRAKEGMLILTGHPGAGKSTLLARLAQLNDSTSDVSLQEFDQHDSSGDAPHDPFTFDAFIHLRGLSVSSAARALAEELGVGLDPTANPVEGLLQFLQKESVTITLLADALDEALSPVQAHLIARDILSEIARLPGCRVVVATRRYLRETGSCEGEGSLITAALQSQGTACTIVDLSSDAATTTSEIEEYVYRRLEADKSARWPSVGKRQLASQEVARQAEGLFLYASFAVHALLNEPESIIDDPHWMNALPRGVAGAEMSAFFKSDMERRFEDPELVRELLTPLAFAHGSGLPRRQIWPELASAFFGKGYGDRSVSQVIREAGWYLIEGTQDGQAVYRLFHRSLRDHLRKEARDALSGVGSPELILMSRLKTLATQDGWRNANPYITHYLSLHAQECAGLEELLDDGAFLAVADPRTLCEGMGTGFDRGSSSASRIYLRCAHLLPDLDPDERAATLALEAAQMGHELAVPRTGGSKWWPLWSFHEESPYSRTLTGHRASVSTVSCAQFSGESIAVSGDTHGHLRIWNLRTGICLHVLKAHRGRVWATALGSTWGRDVCASGGDDSIVRVWDLSTGECLREFSGHSDAVRGITFGRSSGRSVLMSAGSDATVWIWDLRDTSRSFQLREHDWRILSVTFADDALGHSIVVVGHGNGDIRFWNIDQAEEPIVVQGHGREVSGIAYCGQEERFVASGGHDGVLRYWSLGGSLISEWSGHEGAINAVACGQSNHRTVIVTGGDDGTVRLWGPGTGTSRSLSGHSGPVWAVACGRIGRQPVAVTGGEDTTVRVWDTRDIRSARRISGVKGPVWSVDCGQSRGEELAITAGRDGVRIWQLRSGDSQEVRGCRGDVRTVALGRLGRELVGVSGEMDGSVHVFTLSSHATPRRLGLGEGPTWSVACARTRGQDLVITGEESGVRIWDMRTGASHPLGEHRGRVRAVAFGRLGGRLVAVSGGNDCTVRLWLGPGGGLQSKILGYHEGGVGAVSFGRIDGRAIVASGGGGGDIRIWDATTRTELHAIHPHRSRVTGLVCRQTSSGTVVASCASGELVHLWMPSIGAEFDIPLEGCFDIAVHREVLIAATRFGVTSLELTRSFG